MKTSRLLSRVFAVLVAAALALTFSPAATRLAHAAPTITILSSDTVKPVGQPVTVTAVAPGAISIFGDVLVDGSWLTYDSASTDFFSAATLTLTYRDQDPGVLTYRLRMPIGPNAADTAVTPSFQITRTPIVTLRSAPGVSPAGTTITARSKVQPIYAGIGFTEVYTPTRGWLRSQQTSINNIGEFTLPLTYGATTPGTYQWRVGATINGATGRSATFTIIRTPSVQLRSASTVATRGVLTYARGRTYPMRFGLPGFAQVRYGASWVTISNGTTNSLGDFTVPLNYGVNTAGTYAFRLGATINGTRYYTPAFNVTRS